MEKHRTPLPYEDAKPHVNNLDIPKTTSVFFRVLCAFCDSDMIRAFHVSDNNTLPIQIMHTHNLIPTRVDDFDGDACMFSCREW